MIYRYLKHHYILRRSIVVISDQKFSSFFFSKLATTATKNLMDSLGPLDYFGYIQLSRSQEFDNIRLEEKHLN
jgi:hypothetical protein